MSATRERQSAPKARETSLTYKLITGAMSFGAGGLGGAAEVTCFHWLDTMTKRTQDHVGEIRKPGTSAISSYARVYFADSYHRSAPHKFTSLHAGFGYALVYKISQRTYKYGAQPIVNDLLKNQLGGQFEWLFGSAAPIMTNLTAGSLLGLGEAVLLLDLDRKKIQHQTNKNHATDGSKSEKKRQALKVTALRNVIGSGALFGVMYTVKTVAFGLDEKEKLTFGQNVVASTCASLASIGITNPLDVVKTRMQANSIQVSATKTGLSIFKQEGPSAFMKSLGLKCVTQVPKLGFSLFVYNAIVDYVTSELSKHLDKEPPRMRM